MTCRFKTDMRNFTNFGPRTRKSKKFVLMGSLWPKYTMFELKKVRRSYVWWHWRLMQNLRENWLVLWKMTWGIWQICLSFPFSLKEHIWKLNWKESLLIYFESCQSVPCSHWQSRNRMMNTFIIVNITTICNR